MLIEKVSSYSERIKPLENLIYPTPERWHVGNHYIGTVEGEDVAYCQIVPLIWQAGKIIPIEKSFWVYVARVAVTNPRYLASLYRAYYKIQTELMFPLTLISHPTDDAKEFNARLGYEKAPFGYGQWLVKHCNTESELPLFRNRSGNVNG